MAIAFIRELEWSYSIRTLFGVQMELQIDCRWYCKRKENATNEVTNGEPLK